MRTLDLPLLGALLALMVIGLAVLYSAADHSHAAWCVRAGRALRRRPGRDVGAVADPAQRSCATGRRWCSALSLLPLVLVLLIGTGKHGRHWIDLGVFYFQPAELLKLSLPMMVAWYLRPAAAAAALRARC